MSHAPEHGGRVCGCRWARVRVCPGCENSCVCVFAVYIYLWHCVCIVGPQYKEFAGQTMEQLFRRGTQYTTISSQNHPTQRGQNHSWGGGQLQGQDQPMDQASHEPYEDQGSRTVKGTGPSIESSTEPGSSSVFGSFTETGSFIVSVLSTLLGSVLWVRDILVRIRIRGSVPLTYGSESGSWLFCG
jgi:hypothetical protein